MNNTNNELPLQLELEQGEQQPEQMRVEPDDAANAELTPEEVERRKAELVAERAAEIANATFAIPVPKHAGAPSWVQLPEGFRFPRGKQVLFIKFKADWTDTPWKGSPIVDPATGSVEVDAEGKPVLYRQCVLWPINAGDKKLALERARRDPNRAVDELSKQMIRVHDGVEADWAVVRTNGIEMFWNELGEKCRGLLTRIFSRLHVLDSGSTADFLQNCIEVRSTGS